jgi:hypothetical protein
MTRKLCVSTMFLVVITQCVLNSRPFESLDLSNYQFLAIFDLHTYHCGDTHTKFEQNGCD